MTGCAELLTRYARKAGQDPEEAAAMLVSCAMRPEAERLFYVGQTGFVVATSWRNICFVLMAYGDWQRDLKPRVVEFARRWHCNRLHWNSPRRGILRAARMRGEKIRVIAQLYEERI